MNYNAGGARSFRIQPRDLASRRWCPTAQSPLQVRLSPRASPVMLHGESGPVVATAIHDGHAVPRSGERPPSTRPPGSARKTRSPGRWRRWLRPGWSRPSVRSISTARATTRCIAAGRRPGTWRCGASPSGAIARHWPVRRVLRPPRAHCASASTTTGASCCRSPLLIIGARVDGPPADPALHPEINVGTGTVDKTRWGSLIDRFCSDLAGCRVRGHRSTCARTSPQGV